MSYFPIHGVLPPMITPFTADGDVDMAAFVANVELWNEAGLAGYLVCGSNSETAYLNEEEKLALVAATVKHAAPGRLVMAGTGLETPRDTIELTNRCADLGASCALVLPPSYYDSLMNSAALIDFFTRVADKTVIPILLYNVPKYTHVPVKADALAVLCQHPNIIGMKDSSGDVPQLGSFLSITRKEEFNLMVGTAASWLPALQLGIEAGIHALANCMPKLCVAIQDAFLAGQIELARELYLVALPVNTAVTATYGIAGLKHACGRLGFQGGHVRCPLQDSSAADQQAVEKIVAAAQARLEELGVRL